MKFKNILKIKKYPYYFKIIKKRILKSNKKISYSQKGEDLIVDFVFKVLKIEKPTYLDIGTNHPIKINNTYLFYKKGSRGVCVEPNPRLCKLIKKKRARDICLNAGISSEQKDITNYYMMSSDVLNTFSKKEADELIKTTNQTILNVVKIPLIPVEKVINKYFDGKTPNFISLDTEGYDLKILKSINFEKFRPEIICVETLTYTENNTEEKETEIIDFMAKKDYYAHANTYINTIFVDKNKWLNR